MIIMNNPDAVISILRWVAVILFGGLFSISVITIICLIICLVVNWFVLNIVRIIKHSKSTVSSIKE